MIKVYKIDSLPYTPFDPNFIKDDYNYLETNGIKIVSKKKDAHVIVASSTKNLKKFILKNPLCRKYLIWTNEPRNSRTEKHIYYLYNIFPKIHVMNVYTGDVFVNNLTYQEKRFSQSSKLKLVDSNFDLNNQRVVCLMSYYGGGINTKLIIKDIDIDLIKLRSRIALDWYKIDKIDIYGKGWMEGIVKEDSRIGNWVFRKNEILSNYNFNLCFENTVYPKYITEKIWDSIENYCLPIYYGGKNSSIYELFPKNSFIDYSFHESPESMFRYISKMTKNEFIERMNLCIAVYNKQTELPQSYWNNTKTNLLDNIIKKLSEINNHK